MTNAAEIATESHPLDPFLPAEAKILLLGSFPPQRKRWSMEFFYPNWQNDMWRLMGLIGFGDKHHFEIAGTKRFDKDRIATFCICQGIALYDAAYQIRRLNDNASDKFLEVVTPTELSALLNQLPACRAIVTTGQKATDIIVATYDCPEPPVGGQSEVYIGSRSFHFWRMPSTSRAYPLALEKKAIHYRQMLIAEGVLPLL